MEQIVAACKTRIDSASNYFQLLNENFFLSLQDKLNEPKAKGKYLEDLKSSLCPKMETAMLKLNIGGKKCDILRDGITTNPIGWNLLVCLFEPRWEKYLLKDKQGRIYLDMESEALLLLLEQFQELKSKVDSGSARNEALSKLSLRQPSHEVLSQYLQLLELFHCQKLGKNRTIENIQGLWLTALGTFKRREMIKDFYGIFSTQLSDCSGKILSLELLHCNKAGAKDIEGFNFTDEDCQNVVIFAEDKNGNLYGGVMTKSSSCMFTHNVKLNNWEWYSHTSVIHDSYGIKFSFQNPTKSLLIDSLNEDNYFGLINKPSISSFKWDTLEVYSYTFQPADLPLGPALHTDEELAVLIEEHGKKRRKVQEANIQDMKTQCMQEFDVLINLEKIMEVLIEHVNVEKRLFLRELLFVERYLFQQKHSIAGTFSAALNNSIDETKLHFEHMKPKRSKKPKTETAEVEAKVDEELVKKAVKKPRGNRNTSMYIDDQINRLCESIAMNNPTPLEESNTSTESTIKQQQDPILYFNVNGERMCLLKASLMKVLPDCQLAAKASGNWTMQPHEVDEEGNWYINHVTARLFRKLIEFVRMKGREKLESRYSLVVEKDDEEDMRHMLDYLNISNVDIQIK